jgi:holo-[acyl-carrier protein] synthase
MLMIVGIGIDLVELKRIERAMERQPKFVERILTEKERQTFLRLSKKRQVEFLAGRFAVKEAYAKALGTGIGKELSFQDIEVEYDERGKPVMMSINGDRIHVSISHSEHYAIAQVIIERLSS